MNVSSELLRSYRSNMPSIFRFVYIKSHFADWRSVFFKPLWYRAILYLRFKKYNVRKKLSSWFYQQLSKISYMSQFHYRVWAILLFFQSGYRPSYLDSLATSNWTQINSQLHFIVILVIYWDLWWLFASCICHRQNCIITVSNHDVIK